MLKVFKLLFEASKALQTKSLAASYLAEALNSNEKEEVNKSNFGGNLISEGPSL